MPDDIVNERYPIKDNTEYGIIAGWNNDQQHLIMFTLNHYLDIVFSADGEVLSALRHSYSATSSPREEQQAVVETLDRSRPIRVRQFFLPDEHLGIRHYPTTIEETIAEMDSYDDEEREFFQRDIDQWNRSRQFVLHWHKEYYLTQDGVVTSS